MKGKRNTFVEAFRDALDATGEQRRDSAIERVATPALSAAFILCVVGLVRSMPVGLEFTTDDVWEIAAKRSWIVPAEPRAIGAAIVRASKEGLIASTGAYQKSRRPDCHARPVAIWRRV